VSGTSSPPCGLGTGRPPLPGGPAGRHPSLAKRSIIRAVGSTSIRPGGPWKGPEAGWATAFGSGHGWTLPMRSDSAAAANRCRIRHSGRDQWPVRLPHRTLASGSQEPRRADPKAGPSAAKPITISRSCLGRSRARCRDRWPTRRVPRTRGASTSLPPRGCCR
jgi:hypothetical protein